MNERYRSYRWKAFGLTVLLLAGYIILTVLIPKTGRIIDMYDHIQAQQTKIHSADNWQAKLETYNRQQQKLEKFFSKLFVSVPHNDEMSAIVELVFSRARKAAARIQRMSPQDPKEHEGFTEIPLSIQAEGRFHQILKFVNELEQANHLVRLSRLSMAAPENPSSRDLQVEIELSVMIIRKNRPEDTAHG